MTPLKSNYLVLAGVALLVIAIGLAYGPALHGWFIFDDELYLTKAPHIQGPDGLYRIWCTSEASDYYPVTNTSLWLEWQLWGMNPTGYHATNLAMHIVGCLLLWVLLRKLCIPGAFLATLLFAIHPVNVESVAWITQRKNLLALVFFLLSILWYLRAEERRRTRNEGNAEQETRAGAGLGIWYWLSLLAFVLAMFSKGSVAMLPLVLLLIIWWQWRRITIGDLARTAPFFIVSAALTPVNIWFVTHGSGEVLGTANFGQRLAGAGAVVWFYLSKALLPIDLAFIYPQWNVQITDPLWWLPLSASIGVTVVLWHQRRANWMRPLCFVWGFFCLTLVPVLGFTDVGFTKFSRVADHYQHIALIAVVALVAATWSVWLQRAPSAVRPAVIACAVAAPIMLTFLTWQQSHFYTDLITLYQSTLENNPDSWIVRNNLGGEFDRAGRPLEAIEQYRQAVRLKPDFADAFNNLGIVLGRLGRISEAIAQFQQAVTLKESFADAHSNLALALFKINRAPEAIDEFDAALRLQPDLPKAHAGLAAALSREGRFSEAVEHYQLALKFDPQFTEACVHLAETYAQMQQSAEAIAAAQQAMDLARSQGQTALASQIQAWLDNYLAQQANRRDARE